MQKELPYYTVDGDYGWDQDKFPGFLMKYGGCAAVSACDSCIYFSAFKGMPGLYPYDAEHITGEDYIRFAGEMKPYLKPRCGGIDTLELYMDGFGSFLSDRQIRSLRMHPFYGTRSAAEARAAIQGQIDRDIPVPCLMLKHRNKAFEDYAWHWFMLTGYRAGNGGSGAKGETGFQVKAVSYGEWIWFDLDELWDTGYERKGGLILFTYDPV